MSTVGTMTTHGSRRRAVVASATLMVAGAFGAPSWSTNANANTTVSVGPIINVSSACSSQNAESEQAVDPTAPGYVYEVWMGCQGIGFARSTNGGTSFSTPVTLPGAGGSASSTWDPTIAVAPNGNVYAAFILSKGAQYYPVVVTSFNHGATFSQVTSVVPPDPKNWGDRPFLAVGPDGTVYLTWDYGPQRTSIVYVCARQGSCAFSAGDLNVVIQKSTNNAKTFSAMVPISPGFPWSGADAAPLVVEPNGRIDVLYQGFPTDPATHALSPGYNYFTSSTDGGATWSTPVRVGATSGTMALAEWWIEPSLGLDSAGNLYATWDTQGASNDTGWLSWSGDGGLTWSSPQQVPSDTLNVPHIMQVTGGGPGVAYVGWLSPSDPQGYAMYVRAFSTTSGWLTAPTRVSAQFGDPSVWAGDTFGLSTFAPGGIEMSWGSAVPSAGKKSDIYAARVTVP